MRTERSWVVALAFALGCSGGGDGATPIGGSGTGGDSNGTGGSNASTGGAGSATGGSAPGGGTPNVNTGGMGTGGRAIGGSASGGSTAGGSATGGSATGGKGAGGNAMGGSAIGGKSAAGSSAGGAGTTGGRGSGGRSNSGGTTGKGGAATGGSGGGCTQDIACKLAAPPSTGDIYQDCVDRINQFRTQCACLAPLARWTEGEACANQMAEYDSKSGTAHDGFQDKICAGGNAQDECPGWGSNAQVVSGCLQQMWDEGPPPTASCSGTCFNEHGHFINMSTTSNTKVACGFFTTAAGKVWAVQNFSR